MESYQEKSLFCKDIILILLFLTEMIVIYLYHLHIFFLDITRKIFSNSSITYIIFGASFMIGYIYARLKSDNWARLKAYQRYTNFMLLFDRYSAVYEKYYGKFFDFIVSFDHTYLIWKFKTQTYLNLYYQWKF